MRIRNDSIMARPLAQHNWTAQRLLLLLAVPVTALALTINSVQAASITVNSTAPSVALSDESEVYFVGIASLGDPIAMATIESDLDLYVFNLDELILRYQFMIGQGDVNLDGRLLGLGPVGSGDAPEVVEKTIEIQVFDQGDLDQVVDRLLEHDLRRP